jgi:hypothetical protein
MGSTGTASFASNSFFKHSQPGLAERKVEISWKFFSTVERSSEVRFVTVEDFPSPPSAPRSRKAHIF